MYDSGRTVKLTIFILKLSYKEHFKRINERSIVKEIISHKRKRFVQFCIIITWKCRRYYYNTRNKNREWIKWLKSSIKKFFDSIKLQLTIQHKVRLKKLDISFIY